MFCSLKVNERAKISRNFSLIRNHRLFRTNLTLREEQFNEVITNYFSNIGKGHAN